MLLRPVEIFSDGEKIRHNLLDMWQMRLMILHELTFLNFSFLICKVVIIIHLMPTLIRNKNICNILDLYETHFGSYNIKGVWREKTIRIKVK